MKAFLPDDGYVCKSKEEDDVRVSMLFDMALC